MIDEDDNNVKRPRNAQEGANCCSLLTFWYTIPIFRQGYKRDFDESDLTEPLEEHKSGILGDKLENLWAKETQRATKEYDTPNLLRVLFKMLIKPIIAQALMLFIMEIPIRLCQPLYLGLLLRYFGTENQKKLETEQVSPKYILRLLMYWDKTTPISTGEAYFFASGIFLCSLVNVLVGHPVLMSVMHTGMKMRVATCSLMYRKTLRLDLASISGPVVGNVITLMSNDVNRFDIAMLYFHYLWIAPIQMMMALMLMYMEVEMASVIGISALLAVVPIQAWFGNRTSRFRLRTAYRTDERVRQMNEIIQGMQVIKMYTWEDAFVTQIQELRRREMVVLKQTSYIRGAIMSFIMFTTRLAIFLTVIGIAQRDRVVTAEKVFVVTAFYMILRQTMTAFFPLAIAQVAETNVAITRILNFLSMPECKKFSEDQPTSILPAPAVSRLSTALATKAPNKRPSMSQNPNAEPKIDLVDVSAKIGEDVVIHNVSIQLENGGHAAIIGPVGAGKSCLLNVILGELQPCLGQVRIDGVVSYASQEPWLFAGSVHQNILFGRAYDKNRYNSVVSACALARDFQLLPYGDQTIVGEKGASLSGGQRARINLARAVYKEADIYLLDDPLSAVDANVGKHLFELCFTRYLNNKIVILVTHQLQFLSAMKKVILMHDGKVEAQGTYQFLETTGLDFAEFLRNQLSVDEPVELNTTESRVDSIMKGLQFKSSMHLEVIDKEGKKDKPQQTAEMRTEGSVGCAVYKAYCKAGGNCCVIMAVLVLFIAAQFLGSGSDFFLSAWVDVEEKRYTHPNTSGLPLDNVSRDASIGIYSAIIFLTMVVTLTRSFVFFALCVRASINLHNRMFQSIITASMPFFNSNTSGRILNRFSKDLGAVDELLPIAMIDTIQIFLNLVVSVALIACVNYYLIIPTFVMCIAFFFIRRYYIKTSRSVKRLEGISRSPVFAHLNASMQGLVTIRSNGAETLLIKEFDQLQDDHSSAWFMFIATSGAFGFWLDQVCVLYIGVVTYSFMIFANTGGNIGLAITTAIGLTGLFQWGMRQSAELENQMTSVERVLEYSRVEHEPDLQSAPDKKPPSEWPPVGDVQFQDVVMRYKPLDPPVLKSLNLKINPQEKIGIAGRTGAGKSSLIAALFRLAPFEGAIIIDGIDTHDIGLHDLRRKISIIPQEPILFSGTLRYNMDPFNNYNDKTVFDALLVVENKVAITDGIKCLELNVSEGGENISVGERQMICLARAVLRNNKILVLDEATANIDPQTDKLIQTTIRAKFAECTVLTIAHRLHTIMDLDRVLVMDAGIAVEFDHPHVLLQNKTGHFSIMVEKTGKNMANNLREIAKLNYELKQKGTSS